MMKKVTILLTLLMTLALASIVGAEPQSYSSSIQVQNLDESNTANIVITFFDKSGNPVTHSDTVAAGGSNTYFPLPKIAAGFDGSAVISSDREVAAIVNVVADNITFGASYGGFTQGAETVALPLIMRGNGGFNTWFNVQNAGGADTTVTIDYANNTSCPSTAISIPQGAAVTIEQKDMTCLGTKYVGAATVTAASGGSIVASVMEVGATTLFAYNGFAGGGATNPVIPLVNSNNSNYVTGLQLQNVGSSSTSVTVSYTPAGGIGTACTETKTIGSGASATFAFYAFGPGTEPGNAGTNNCTVGQRFVGSAVVSNNTTSQPLVGIVNQLNLAAAKGSAYNAFDPASATDTVVMPLIMDRNSGFYTGMNVINVGSGSSTVTCTYVKSSDNTTVKTDTSGSLAPNQAFNRIHDQFLADKFVGSATCVANGANGLLLGQVNELGTGSGDQLFTYEAINK